MVPVGSYRAWAPVGSLPCLSVFSCTRRTFPICFWLFKMQNFFLLLLRDLLSEVSVENTKEKVLISKLNIHRPQVLNSTFPVYSNAVFFCGLHINVGLCGQPFACMAFVSVDWNWTCLLRP